MAVYVDDIKAAFSRMVMRHMLANTDDELHAMADRIGVQRRWWQSPAENSGSHYDIALSKRAPAVQAGAIEITWLRASAMNMRPRITGLLGSADDELAWFEQHKAKRRAAAEIKMSAGQVAGSRCSRSGCLNWSEWMSPPTNRLPLLPANFALSQSPPHCFPSQATVDAAPTGPAFRAFEGRENATISSPFPAVRFEPGRLVALGISDQMRAQPAMLHQNLPSRTAV